MVLEQPSAILEDGWLQIAVVVSNTFRGNPFDNQAAHANINQAVNANIMTDFSHSKTTLPWLLQECVSAKMYLITYPCRFDSFTWGLFMLP